MRPAAAASAAAPAAPQLPRPFWLNKCCRHHLRLLKIRCSQAAFYPSALPYDVLPAMFCHQPAQALQQQITLATQVSLDRWPRWVQQAESWKGPLSLAVYVPAPQHCTAAQASLQLIKHRAEAFSQNNPLQPLLVSVLFSQHFAREGVSALRGRIDPSDHPLLQPHAAHTPTYDQLYPINALRNLALQQVATSLVLFADADFVFARNLLQHLSSPQPHGQQLVEQLLQTSSAQQQEDQGDQQEAAPVMLVLPCFQLALGQDLPDTERAAVPANKTDLRKALASGTVVPFHCGVFAPLKQPVDVSRWLGEEEVYEVPFVEYFEPQGIAVKQQLPLYDECFRGYGLNKVQHAWHMAASGFKFKVLPDAFMVTAPHNRSSTWRPQPGTASDDEHLNRIRLVYAQFKQRIRQQVEQQL